MKDIQELIGKGREVKWLFLAEKRSTNGHRGKTQYRWGGKDNLFSAIGMKNVDHEGP